MKKFLVVILLAVLPALAQQKPSDAMVQGFTNELEQQRNAAGTRAASLAGLLHEAAEREKARDAEIERLKKLCGKPCEPVKEHNSK